MKDNIYWYWLCNLKGIGIKKIDSLIRYYNNPKCIFNAKRNDLQKIKQLNEKDIDELTDEKNKIMSFDKYNQIVKDGIRFITRNEKEYPQKLLNIYCPPWGIYVKGKLPREKAISIAIVGARNCSAYGRETAYWFAEKLSQNNINIISGLARGIDSYSHKGALSAGGYTCGVLGCGINICYPPENIELYKEIEGRGGIISEYGFDVKPVAGNFPMRNRIISGLSDGILVIEAKRKSGSLITADLGLEQGKEIYVLPGRVTDSLSEGCNRLIKQGARCVTDPCDILEDLPLFNKAFCIENKKSKDLLETKEKIVYASLSLEEKHIEQISYETGFAINEVMEVVLSLEMKEYIIQTEKNHYIVLS